MFGKILSSTVNIFAYELKCIVFLYVIKYIIVNDCFVICVGSSLLSKTVDVTLTPNKGPTHSVLTN